MTANPQNQRAELQTWFFGGIASAVVALYYAVFYFPPRLVGANDPDRFYHLGISQLLSTEGLLRVLPQVEDLGRGRYFPDKEFLFHAITGTAYWGAGPLGVMLVVPILGMGIAACLYWLLARILPPWQAVVLALMGVLLSPGLLFRLTLLHPHVLAILCFCLLLAGILRGRPWLAAAAAAAFVLSYHAFYIPMFVIVIAAALRWPPETSGARRWQWAILGLLCGIVLNPYFPSTLVMSWSIVKLGMDLSPGLQSGEELQSLGPAEYLDGFGFLPAVLLECTLLIIRSRLRPSAENAGFWFLFILSSLLTLFSLKSARATEYAIPSIILLTGYGLALTRQGWWFPLACLFLVATQAHSSWTYYKDIWGRPQGGDSPWYLAAVAALPPAADGQKVFNCEWSAGAYILFARPQVRFVDLLEPALLWQSSPDKYRARQRLLSGLDSAPQATLRGSFGASYVLCGTAALNRQMQADPLHFEPLADSPSLGPLRIYQIRE